MSDGTLNVLARLERLERQARRARALAAASLLAAGALAVSAWTRSAQPASVLRARMLVIEDDRGRRRIILGAPLPRVIEGGRPLAPRIGMVIHDSAGYERWGLSLKASGAIGMGFDAPPGTGDDRNRERINITADESGGADIRMLDRATWVRALLVLDEKNDVSLLFQDFPPGEFVQRRLSVRGDTTVRTPRR
jgi:hypothetical protein